ncbi:family 3 glycoside hydrolase [Apiospora saccharicola]
MVQRHPRLPLRPRPPLHHLQCHIFRSQHTPHNLLDRQPNKPYQLQRHRPPGSGNYPDLAPFATVNITVTNTGSKNVTSDYVILLFARGEYGPTPYPNKSLVGFARAHGVAPGATAEVALPLKLGALARGDGDGNLVLWPGKYTLALDVDERDVWDFEITGDEVVLERLAPASVPDGGVLSSTGSDAVLE